MLSPSQDGLFAHRSDEADPSKERCIARTSNHLHSGVGGGVGIAVIKSEVKMLHVIHAVIVVNRK